MTKEFFGDLYLEMDDKVWAYRDEFVVNHLHVILAEDGWTAWIGGRKHWIAAGHEAAANKRSIIDFATNYDHKQSIQLNAAAFVTKKRAARRLAARKLRISDAIKRLGFG